MKRILHVANFNLFRLKKCYLNSITLKINNGLIRHGYHVITYPDRDLCRMFGFGHMNWFGRRKLQKHLIEFARAMKPDAVILGHADTVEQDTLFKLREIFPDIKILQYNVDRIVPGITDNNIAAINSKLDAVDATIITTAERKLLDMFKRDGKFVGFFPNPVDDSIERENAYLHEKLPYDLMLCVDRSVRQFCGKYVPCEEIIADIRKQIPDLKLLLAGIDKHHLLEGAAYQDAHGTCAMGFNLSRINDVYLYTSDRLAHSVGNGQLAVLDDRTGYKDIFSDDEMCFFHTPEEMLEKIAFYHKNPRERMRVAKNGAEKYRRLFNEKVVGAYIADILFGEPTAEKYFWLGLDK